MLNKSEHSEQAPSFTVPVPAGARLLHVTVADDDSGPPSEEDMAELADLFLQAAHKGETSVVVTRAGVTAHLIEAKESFDHFGTEHLTGQFVPGTDTKKESE